MTKQVDQLDYLELEGLADALLDFGSLAAMKRWLITNKPVKTAKAKR